MPSIGSWFAAAALLLVPVAAHAESQDLVILVASPTTPAGRAAAGMAGAGVVTTPRLFSAFDLASAQLTKCQTCTVTIEVAGGVEVGKAKVAQWTFPETDAPKATLRILGGYADDFKTRKPLTHPTVLQIPEQRSGPVVRFEGRKPRLAEVTISGFAIDVSPGNRYDARTGALQKGSSSSWPILAFGALVVERLVIADNIFANAANGVGGPAIRAASASASVVVRNNYFLNNVHCWQVTGLPTTPYVDRYVIEGNTFLRNFPYNPDRTTSNPGTLEIGGNYTAKQVVIRGNLFAHNPGGAIFPQWDEKRGPPLEIADNLFFDNAALFETADPGAGAVVGKFAGSGVHAVYTPAEVTEEFSWKAQGNVVLDPRFGSLDEPKQPASSKGSADSDGEDGDGVEVVRNKHIDSFARRYVLRVSKLPAPGAAAARRYGASADRVLAP